MATLWHCPDGRETGMTSSSLPGCPPTWPSSRSGCWEVTGEDPPTGPHGIRAESGAECTAPSFHTRKARARFITTISTMLLITAVGAPQHPMSVRVLALRCPQWALLYVNRPTLSPARQAGFHRPRFPDYSHLPRRR